MKKSILVIFLTVITSTNLFAQNGGAIRGVVTDENGAKVAGARVVLNLTSGLQLTTHTDQSGTFEYKGLRSGSYLIQFKADGFAEFTSEPVQIDRGQTKEIAVQLKVAALSANVVVTATGTAQRADEVAKVVSTLDSEQIEAKHELTLAEALRGTPGVRVQQQGSPGALTTVRLRGQRNFDTSLLLDGLRVRDASDINGSALSLITDLVPVAVDRVEILRGEIGRASCRERV